MHEADKMRNRHDVDRLVQTYLGRMEILLVVLLLLAFDFAAMRWGVDSRRAGWTVL
jgi:hypothetical protein